MADFGKLLNASDREQHLAPYAMRENLSRGRRYPEAEHPYRGLFQRDRDRILHASAFRRLTAKTQVLVWGTNDHHRTRLTHTLEVAQVSRTIARVLNLNEDLSEAIALAHDLGHPPFGHAGESALDECLRDHGGFEHNRQGLRIVELLEQRYPTFPGLNLTWEVRESLAFHSKRPDSPEIQPYRHGIKQPTLEAQIVDAADSVVYDVHDLEDAFGVKLIDLDDVRQLQYWQTAEQQLTTQFGTLPVDRLIPSVLRILLGWRERELVAATLESIRQAGITSVEQIKAQSQPLVQEGKALEPVIGELKHFLLEKVYHHPEVHNMSSRGKGIVRGLFEAYSKHPEEMPPAHVHRADPEQPQRTVGDYVAGMTDRLAALEYRRLFHTESRADMIESFS